MNGVSTDCHAQVHSNLENIISQYGVEEKVKIKDVAKVEKLIQMIKESGPNQLQVITDFDATLACYHSKGKRCATSYGVISNSRLVPEDVKASGAILYNQYHPFEIDTTISEEERAAKLGEWYEKKHENYLKVKILIREEELTEVVKEAHLDLRENSQEVLKKLHSHEIPTLVFSAGSGDTVKEVLRLNKVDFPNTKVIANFMKFDENRELVGFSCPIIHPGNKNGTVVKEEPYFEALKNRHNAILLGDTIGDATMATGMPTQKAILKIGFLNLDNPEKYLDAFMEVFDVVLIDDQTFHFVNALLDRLLET